MVIISIIILLSFVLASNHELGESTNEGDPSSEENDLRFQEENQIPLTDYIDDEGDIVLTDQANGWIASDGETFYDSS
ncbi:MAG: hypothetical protein Q8R18_03210, partial [bacterium]|nr:hypothetical protein [bacterium]